MYMKKFRIVIAASLVGACVLAGCGSQAASNTNSGTTASTTATESTTKAAEVSSTEAAKKAEVSSTAAAKDNQTSAAENNNKTTTTTAANTATGSMISSDSLVTDGGLKCPYCGLVYDGSIGNAGYYTHFAACASANGDGDTLSECSYCGELFSTKYEDPSAKGKTMYENHMEFEEWAHRDYVMCQKCGEYYKNGTEHVCSK